MYAPYAGFAGMLEHKNGKFTVIKPKQFLGHCHIRIHVHTSVEYFPLSILISMSICWTFSCLLELKDIHMYMYHRLPVHIHVHVHD